MSSAPTPQAKAGSSVDVISIRGARTHNLRNIDVDLPRDSLVVISGRSGSGKSSLAFDTLFAEGQRQFLESLSLSSRQFLGQLPRADVDFISGLPPTVCLDQSAPPASRRRTVGTVSEVYDYLRLLLARTGEVRCWKCGRTLAPKTVSEIRDRLLALPERTKVMVLAPITDGTPGTLDEGLRRIRAERLIRIRLNGAIHDIDQLPPCDRQAAHQLQAITDRIIIREGVERRLLEALDHAATLSVDGRVVTQWLVPEDDQWAEHTDATEFGCPDCGTPYDEIQPRTFSFHSPHGACPECDGLGSQTDFDPQAILDEHLSIAGGAVRPWVDLAPAAAAKWRGQLDPVLSLIEQSVDLPLDQWTSEQRDMLLDHVDKQAPGLRLILQRELATTPSEDRQRALEALLCDIPCRACQGTRLGPIGRSVYWEGMSVGELVELSIDELLERFAAHNRQPTSDAGREEVTQRLVEAITHRLAFLSASGAGYLSLNRSTATLSGGEYQRVRLAAALGTGVTSACFILDEPSVGLHPGDTQRLLTLLRGLQAQGNSLVVVEHNPGLVEQADYLIDLGPGAGVQGGKVIAQGTTAQVAAWPDSPTGKLLQGHFSELHRQPRSVADDAPRLRLCGASGHNLQAVDLEVPLRRMTCVTGVSGSGKSTLVIQTLAPALIRVLGQAAVSPLPHQSLSGWESLTRVVQVDQRPIGQTPRACPATFCGLLDPIRKLFAATRDAKQRGFGIGRFSFNGKSGACRECRGLGYRTIELDVLPPAQVPCDACLGRRYNRQTLQVRYGSRSIADVLTLSVSEAAEVFDGIESLRHRLRLLEDVGLGYLRLDQPAHTLSGGEAQRLKLVQELARPNHEPAMVILDEPTRGLHAADVQMLLQVLDRLVEQGHTLVVVEHHLQMMAAADWIVDLGPGGGGAGGRIVAQGTPSEIAKTADSLTGKCLKEWLEKTASRPSQPSA